MLLRTTVRGCEPDGVGHVPGPSSRSGGQRGRREDTGVVPSWSTTTSERRADLGDALDVGVAPEVAAGFGEVGPDGGVDVLEVGGPLPQGSGVGVVGEHHRATAAGMGQAASYPANTPAWPTRTDVRTARGDARYRAITAIAAGQTSRSLISIAKSVDV